jgi:predicted DNA-binding protein with PD1-like motif
VTAGTEPVQLRHPGPAPAVRIVSVPTRARTARCEVQPGERLVSGLWRLLEKAGGRAGSAELSGGEFRDLPYVFPAVSHDPSRAVTFTEPQVARGASALLLGSATIGHRDGERFTHAHAGWRDGTGALRGGHLLEGATAGDVPISVVLHAYDDVELHNGEDPETLMPVFCPEPSPGPERVVHPADVVVSRVRPGVDLVEAVRHVCAEAGWDRAVVHSSLGSTVGARLRRGGEAVEVPGPAVEFTSVVGVVAGALSGSPDVDLTGTCVDVAGVVHSGTILAGRNPVAVTFELVVQRSAS